MKLLHRAGLTLIALLFMGPLAAQASCPLTIGIAANGDVFTSVFNGWYRRSLNHTEENLQAGCYPDPEGGGTNPISSVKLELAPSAPAAKVDQIYAMLARHDWPKSKLVIKVWKNAPSQPKD
jgi:hypothetical protein